jgi:hypothetical protein
MPGTVTLLGTLTHALVVLVETALAVVGTGAAAVVAGAVAAVADRVAGVVADGPADWPGAVVGAEADGSE